MGVSDIGTGVAHGFLYDGTLHDLGALRDSSNSAAYDINQHGQVVGSSDDANGEAEAAICQNGVWTSLGSL